MVKTELDKKIEKARVQLLLHEPFFGTLVLNVVPVPTEDVEVAATDGVRFFYNPKIMDQLDVEEIKFVIAHEAMHCAFEHAKRKGTRDHNLWNCAGDYVINLTLVDAGFKMPKMPAELLEKAKKAGAKSDNLGLLEEKYRQKNADVVYTDLFNNKKNPFNGMCTLIFPKSGNDKDKCQDGNKDGMGEPDWPIILAQAAHKARQQGRLPGHMEELINEILNPKIPWYEKLRQYLTRFSKEEPRWNKPNKKFLNRRIYLPSICGETAEIVVGVDTSGSVDTEELKQFYGEVDAIRRTYKMKLHMIYCDAEVHRIDTLEPWDELNFKVVGRGGTSFVPVFKKVEELGIVPDVALYFTDGDGTFPDAEPEYDTLWVLSKGDRKVPFGEKIIID